MAAKARLGEALRGQVKKRIIGVQLVKSIQVQAALRKAFKAHCWYRKKEVGTTRKNDLFWTKMICFGPQVPKRNVRSCFYSCEPTVGPRRSLYFLIRVTRKTYPFHIVANDLIVSLNNTYRIPLNTYALQQSTRMCGWDY